MLRRSVGVLLLLLLAALSATAATPEASFELGMRAFRAADYASAIVDLQYAADAFGAAGVERMASYQTALVYLALAQFRLDREDDARATVNRLLEAERAYPAYATLPLDADARDFEALSAALVPDNALPRNTQFVAGDAMTALPTVRPVTPVTPPQETPLPTATPAAVEATAEVRVEEIQADTARRVEAVEVETNRRIAAIEAEANRRIAEIQADADRRIAAAQASADARVAAAQAAANERVAAAEQQAQRDADARIAALNRRADEQIAAADTQVPATTMPTETRPAVTTSTADLTTLRQADELVRRGEMDGAHELYTRLANDRNVERNVLAESAVGLYRIGSYRESVDAFRRMNVFARGEEDLRYYFAVALYESGDYRGAQKELACALPFIEVTDDVARYRLKIEQAAAVTMARNF
ncbi:MAG TPA: hypothetical protein VE010_22720 [Thermoanaerobaculia bacterium]|nr:hypothetical protein [Thermoanaerobaculia bacterium]